MQDLTPLDRPDSSRDLDRAPEFMQHGQKLRVQQESGSRAKRRERTSAETVGALMDWSKPHGLETPAPAAFLGGLEEMPAGSTGYFTVTLTPGRYAWIAEVPDPETKGMLNVFDVGDGGGQS